MKSFVGDLMVNMIDIMRNAKWELEVAQKNARTIWYFVIRGFLIGLAWLIFLWVVL